MQEPPKIFETIKKRTSVRGYLQDQIEPGQQAKILAASLQLEEPPFQADIRIEWAAATAEDPHVLKGLGTYGFIKNPSAFLIGAVKPKPKAMVDFGLQMERMVLLLEEMDLGSCWLGGTFKKSRFAEMIALADDESIPAVLSVGYPKEKRGGLDRTVRWAPSASNRQPWRIVRTDNGKTFHFYLQRDPKYTKTLKRSNLADLQMVDMGIGLCHFLASTEALGLTGQCFEDPTVTIECPEYTEYVLSWKENS